MSKEDLRRRYEALAQLDETATKTQKQQRGRDFERLLGAVLDAEGLSPRLDFRPDGEQIDGSFYTSTGNFYLLEAKWHAKPLPVSEIFSFKGKLDGKLQTTLGVFISASGYSDDAPDALTKGKPINVILWGREDLDALFVHGSTFTDILNRKLRAAAEKGEVYLVVRPEAPSRTRFRVGIRDVMRQLREDRATAMIREAGGHAAETPKTLEDAVSRLSATAITALAADSGYAEAQEFQRALIKTGGVAVKLIEATEEADEGPEWLAKQLARAASHFDHAVPPWELWLMTVSFYADRTAAAEGDRYDDLEAICGLLIEAHISVDGWEWHPDDEG